jgi:hypothetical protein
MGLRMSAFYQPPSHQPGQPMLGAFFKARSPGKSPGAKDTWLVDGGHARGMGGGFANNTSQIFCLAIRDLRIFLNIL